VEEGQFNSPNLLSSFSKKQVTPKKLDSSADLGNVGLAGMHGGINFTRPNHNGTQ
jgi:hypothetical protein